MSSPTVPPRKTATADDLEAARQYALRKIAQKRGYIIKPNPKTNDITDLVITLNKERCEDKIGNVWSEFNFNYETAEEVQRDEDSVTAYREWYGGEMTESCRAGFTIFRRWCEIPKSRKDENGKLMKDASFPPFRYLRETRDCVVTKEYCERMGVGYKDGDCYTSLFQQALEMMFGTTITRLLATAYTKYIPEGMRIAFEIFLCVSTGGAGMLILYFFRGPADGRKFLGECTNAIGVSAKKVFYHAVDGVCKASDFLGDKVGSAVVDFGKAIGNAAEDVGKAVVGFFTCDSRIKCNIVRLRPNFFGDGIHLYIFRWTDDARRVGITDIGQPYVGPIAEEVQRVYPDIVQVDPETSFLRIIPNSDRTKRLFCGYPDYVMAEAFLQNILDSLATTRSDQLDHIFLSLCKDLVRHRYIQTDYVMTCSPWDN